MADKAVFMDRDDTLIEDSGYISDPAEVKLLPGVELAIKSLRRAGYKIVVVTNQSGVARGMFTEQTLKAIHAELQRQLTAKGAELDAVYYCPYHPDGAVSEYAVQSDLRKPAPGMLLKAAEDMQIDLAASWMVGNSPSDVEAGRRAGCRTVFIRSPRSDAHEAPRRHEQADHTAGNLVEAARQILRTSSAVESDAPQQRLQPVTGREPETPEEPGEPAAHPDAQVMDDSEVRREILRLLRQLVKTRQIDEFSLSKLVGGVLQVLALLTLLLTFWQLISSAPVERAVVWATVTVALQVMALTFFIMQQRR